MIGQVVLAGYRPRPGRERELLTLLRRHVPTLRSENLASDRPVLLLRAQDGTYVEIFEWTSKKAAGLAHMNARVLEIWNQMEQVADFVRLADLHEADYAFSHFNVVEGIVQ